MAFRLNAVAAVKMEEEAYKAKPDLHVLVHGMNLNPSTPTMAAQTEVLNGASRDRVNARSKDSPMDRHGDLQIGIDVAPARSPMVHRNLKQNRTGEVTC